MTIYLDSRYADGVIYTANNSTKGTYELSVNRVFPTTTQSFNYYVWNAANRIDQIAYQFYGDAEYWHYIMDFNPEILNPFEIAPGTLIRIPSAI
jgi:nucleoid-associated protein YgaU